MAVVSIISIHYDRKFSGYSPAVEISAHLLSSIGRRVFRFIAISSVFLPAEYQDTLGRLLRSPLLYQIEQTIIGMISIQTVSNLFCVASKFQKFLFRLIPEHSYQWEDL